MRDKLVQPRCSGCEQRYFHDENTVKTMKGVRMQPFEYYCLACKRPRMFRGRDPKNKVPAWCPKRKSPYELRIYGFKSADDWMLHERLCRSLGREISPSAHHYALRHEDTTELSAYDFWKRCDTEPESELLPVFVTLHEIVEIDDGIRPEFFYKTRRGYRIVYGYKPAARK